MEIRALENNIANLLSKAVLKGASHLYAGQEAVAVGAVAALRDDDFITSTHRGHGHAHAHGDHYAKTPEAKQDHYNKMMAEVLGKSGGYCKGKGGSMHIADVEHGNLGATGIVGGNIPVAVGAGLSQKMQGTDRVVVCFFGDGASNEGTFHESLNMAQAWESSGDFRLRKQHVRHVGALGKCHQTAGCCQPRQRLWHPRCGCGRYGCPRGARRSVAEAVERARKGEGPTLIEAKTYRWYGHSHSDPRAYRTREEEAEWKKRDPITVMKDNLEAVKMLTESEFETMEDQRWTPKWTLRWNTAMPPPNRRRNEVDTDVYAPSKFTAGGL